MYHFVVSSVAAPPLCHVPAATTVGATCFFPACSSSPAENGEDDEKAVAIFRG
jgi:hypothetical protein